MTINSNTYFDEKHGEGKVTLAKDEKAFVLRLPETGKGIPRRKLKGDRNQCPVYVEYFNSIKAFDQHRTGSFDSIRCCLTIADMQAKNFRKTKDDFWLCPVALKDRKRINRIQAKSKKPSTVTTVTEYHV